MSIIMYQFSTVRSSQNCIFCNKHDCIIKIIQLNIVIFHISFFKLMQMKSLQVALLRRFIR